MIDSYSQANGELYKPIKDILESVEIVTLFGYAIDVRWPNNEKLENPTSDKIWVRVSRQTVSNPQTAIQNNYRGQSARKYTNYGLLFVQLFSPKTNGVYPKVEKLAETLLKNAFRGKSTEHCITFRNARMSEVTPENDWYRLNVVTEYEYDEIS